MPRRSASTGPLSSTRSPSSSSAPRVGARWPLRIFISVDLPAPFSPMMACASPARTVIETSLSTSTGPNERESPTASSKGFPEAEFLPAFRVRHLWPRRRRSSRDRHFCLSVTCQRKLAPGRPIRKALVRLNLAETAPRAGEARTSSSMSVGPGRRGRAATRKRLRLAGSLCGKAIGGPIFLQSGPPRAKRPGERLHNSNLRDVNRRVGSNELDRFLASPLAVPPGVRRHDGCLARIDKGPPMRQADRASISPPDPRRFGGRQQGAEAFLLARSN